MPFGSGSCTRVFVFSQSIRAVVMLVDFGGKCKRDAHTQAPLVVATDRLHMCIHMQIMEISIENGKRSRGIVKPHRSSRACRDRAHTILIKRLQSGLICCVCEWQQHRHQYLECG